ncbi:putative YkwD family protein [Scopulibacillus daqui]|uniref:YkwD family protein n=1 Tax=Scopulibacillus daqui TaxID=1469162 RepID=A0ABS2Q4I3_9BACL|nr:CAP domain-containing protein [Scopulibacillus daqui]MBM7646402.1 putative YkwD family protein [Scopulibacillus daqui]
MKKILGIVLTSLLALPLFAVHHADAAGHEHRQSAQTNSHSIHHYNKDKSKNNDQTKPAATDQNNKAAGNDQNAGQTGSSKSQLNAFEQKVVELTNQERQKKGLKPLKADNQLAKMARDKSQDMADKGYFDHQSPTYGSPFDMMKTYGIKYTAAGENIAAGQQTPQDVVNSWMKSPGHRANILNKDYTYIGVGYVKGGSYGSYWTQEFIKK